MNAIIKDRIGDYLDKEPAGLSPMLRALPVVDAVGQWQRQLIRLFEIEARLEDFPRKGRWQHRNADAEEQEFVT